METMYQRGKIQEESLYYETRKHDGSLPIVGVNTFLSGADAAEEHKGAQLIRSTEEEKQDQVAAVRPLHARQAPRSPAGLRRHQLGGGRGRRGVLQPWGGGPGGPPCANPPAPHHRGGA